MLQLEHRLQISTDTERPPRKQGSFQEQTLVWSVISDQGSDKFLMTILNRPGSFVLPKIQHLFSNTDRRAARRMAALERDRQKLIERNAYLEELRKQHRIVWDYRERTIANDI